MRENESQALGFSDSSTSMAGVPLSSADAETQMVRAKCEEDEEAGLEQTSWGNCLDVGSGLEEALSSF